MDIPPRPMLCLVVIEIVEQVTGKLVRYRPAVYKMVNVIVSLSVQRKTYFRSTMSRESLKNVTYTSFVDMPCQIMLRAFVSKKYSGSTMAARVWALRLSNVTSISAFDMVSMRL
jgi:hypothetical protein